MLTIARRRLSVTLVSNDATSLPEDKAMRELLRTNDSVLLGYVEVLLADQGIAAVIFDGHISLMEGSIGAFPRRLLVDAAHWDRATRVMRDADLGAWVNNDEPA